VFAAGTRKPGQHFRSEMAGAVTVGFAGIARGVLVLDQVDPSPDGAMQFRLQGTEGVLRGSFTRLECCGAATGGPWVACELVGLGDWQQMVHDSYIGTMSDLMNALNTGQEPPCSGRDNLKSVAMYEAARRSSVEGRVVTLAEVTNDT
jgi:predicted dehydrogenase